MKKVLLICILFCYSAASFGVSLNYFYCCGKLKSVSFFVNTKENTCKGKTKKTCCNNKVVTLQLKIDQKDNNKENNYIHLTTSPVLVYATNFSHFTLIQTFDQTPKYVNPPPGYLPSRQILYCTFRI